LKRCVIFDFAFTLVEFHFDYFSAFSKIKETYLKLGIPENILEKFEGPNMFLMMNSVYDWMMKYLPKDKADELQRRVARILEDFEMTGLRDAKLMPHCKVTLEKVKKLGLKIGVVSDNSKRFILAVLKKFSLLNYFDAIVGRDSPGRMKPYPDHLLLSLDLLECDSSGAVFVGDEDKDMICAKEIGALGIGVLTGWNKKGLEESAHAEKLISNLSELPSILKALE